MLLTYDFEKAILRYTEYPPDANRGFDIAPAIIGILEPEPERSQGSEDSLGVGADGVGVGERKVVSYLRTTSLLLYLPTPDFSMPYNVIILTSTVIALAFGTVFNILVRKFVLKSEAPRLGGRIGRLVGRLRNLVARGQGKGKE